MSRSSSTAIEARATSASGLPPEDDLGRTDRDRVAGPQLGALQAPAVYLGAVGGIEVDDPIRRALLPNLGMPARHIWILDLDVGVLRAADHDFALCDLMLVAVPGKG